MHHYRATLLLYNVYSFYSVLPVKWFDITRLDQQLMRYLPWKAHLLRHIGPPAWAGTPHGLTYTAKYTEGEN